MEKEDVIISGGLYTRIILEIVGGPKEHVEKTMSLLVDTIKKQKELKVETYEIVPAEKKDEWWSTFCEMEVLFKKLDDVIEFIYEFMPSSIEIIDPQRITIENHHLSHVFNNLIARLHNTDMLLKEQAAQKKLIERANSTLIKFSIRQALSQPRTIAEISKLTGIKEERLPEILHVLEKQGMVRTVKDKYELV